MGRKSYNKAESCKYKPEVIEIIKTDSIVQAHIATALGVSIHTLIYKYVKNDTINPILDRFPVAKILMTKLNTDNINDLFYVQS